MTELAARCKLNGTYEKASKRDINSGVIASRLLGRRGNPGLLLLALRALDCFARNDGGKSTDERLLERWMNVAQRMEQLLREKLVPTSLEVIDDSGKHAGHAGARAEGESHFTVKIVSERFASANRIARHRMVYDAVKPLIDEGLHALAIDAKAPGEA